MSPELGERELAALRYENHGTVAQRHAYVCWLALRASRRNVGWRYVTAHNVGVWQPSSMPDLFVGVLG